MNNKSISSANTILKELSKVRFGYFGQVGIADQLFVMLFCNNFCFTLHV